MVFKVNSEEAPDGKTFFNNYKDFQWGSNKGECLEGLL